MTITASKMHDYPDLLRRMDDLYDSEIDFVFHVLWDGGVDWYVVNGINPAHAFEQCLVDGKIADEVLDDAGRVIARHGTVQRNVAAQGDGCFWVAMRQLQEAAVEMYPDSEFARCYGTVLNGWGKPVVLGSVHAADTLMNDLREFGAVELFCDDPGTQATRDPYESIWTCQITPLLPPMFLSYIPGGHPDGDWVVERDAPNSGILLFAGDEEQAKAFVPEGDGLPRAWGGYSPTEAVEFAHKDLKEKLGT